MGLDVNIVTHHNILIVLALRLFERTFDVHNNVRGYERASRTNNVHLDFNTLFAEGRCGRSDRVKLNLGVRYEYFGPQTKSDPKYDSNFYWGDPTLNINEATPQQILQAVRSTIGWPAARASSARNR